MKVEAHLGTETPHFPFVMEFADFAQKESANGEPHEADQ